MVVLISNMKLCLVADKIALISGPRAGLVNDKNSASQPGAVYEWEIDVSAAVDPRGEREQCTSRFNSPLISD